MNQKLIVVSGPTGSGKTALALKLAKKYGGYIINADSRTIYKDLDVGTAKPTKAQQRRVKHYLLDIIPPEQHFTVGDFKRRAEGIINARKGLPFIVGGTGLYITALVENWHLGRRRGSGTSPTTTSPTAIAPTKGPAKYDALVLVLNPPRRQVYQKLNQRVKNLWRRGLVVETKRLREQYDFSLPAFTGIGYREVAAYLDGKLSKAQAIATIQTNTRRYAKRQLTWWRHRPGVQWVTTQRQTEKLIRQFLEIKKENKLRSPKN